MMATRLRAGMRMALAATSAGLAMGLVLMLLVSGPAEAAATALVWTGLGLLVLVPVLNVVTVLIDEWHRTPRMFAYAALAVLGLLLVTVLTVL